MRQLIMVVLVLLLIGGCASYSQEESLWAMMTPYERQIWSAMTPQERQALWVMAVGDTIGGSGSVIPLTMPPIVVPPIEPILIPLPATTTGYIGHDPVFLQTYKGIPGYVGDTTVGHIGHDNVYIQHPR